MKRFVAMTAALVMVAAMVQVGSVKAGSAKGNTASKSGVAVAFAKLNIGTASVLTFGGKGTTSAVVSDGDSNSFVDVTFTGKYPKGITTTQVVINASAESSDYGVANAIATSANSTQLVIEVSGWVSDTKALNGETVFVSVFLGQ